MRTAIDIDVDITSIMNNRAERAGFSIDGKLLTGSATQSGCNGYGVDELGTCRVFGS